MIKKLVTHFTGDLSPTKKIILKNTAWLTGAEIGSRILRGILSIVVARMLGTTGLGVFSYALALGGFLTFFEEAGVGTYVIRSHARRDENRTVIFGTAFVLKLILGIIALVLFMGAGPLLSNIPEANKIIPVVALLIFFDQLRGFLFSITRAEERMHVESIIQITTNIFIALLGIIALSINASPFFLALGYLTGSAAGTLTMLFVVRNHIPNLKKTFDKKIFKEIFFAAWPFTILAASNVLIYNTDSLFLGHYGTPTDVGLYSAASRLIMMFYVLSSVFATATFPTLVKKIAEGVPLKKIITKFLLIAAAVASPLILMMTFGSTLFMKLLFGISFVAAAPILIILSFTYIPVFAKSILNNAILAKDIQGKFIIANIAGVLVNIGLDFILVPKYLGVGAAIASLAGLSTITLITVIKLKTYVNK